MVKAYGLTHINLAVYHGVSPQKVRLDFRFIFAYGLRVMTRAAEEQLE